MRWSQSFISHDNRSLHRWQERKISLVCILFCCEILLDLWTVRHGRGQRVCRQVGSCLCNSTADKNVWQSETGRGENVLKTDKPCLDGRLQVCLCVQMSSWVNWLCCRVGVCVSAHGSLTTAACHYRPWLLFTGASWPVEVHLGGLPHLSGPGLGLKLIYRPLIWCLVLIVPGRLLISKLFNVFTLMNQAVRMLWPLLEILM